jgi:hypothetical protein
MRFLATDFGKHTRTYSRYSEVSNAAGMSRVMFDVLIAQAKEAGYVVTDSERNIYLTDKGKFYILENKFA